MALEAASSFKWSRLVRRTHMYLALFLTPWVVIYALSGLVLNHNATVREFYGGDYNRYQLTEEREFLTEFSPETDPKLVGAQILEELNLEGGFWVQGNLSQQKMVVHRDGGMVSHRVNFFPREHRLAIEKQVVTAPTFLHKVHFRHGYEQPFLAADIWGFAVDLVIVSMMLWIGTGIWMWWEIKPTRKSGAAFGALGLGLFLLLLATI